MSDENCKTIKVLLAGNPNVGKSTVFNALTGMKQHTGNWIGKTVECARGYRKFGGVNFEFTDLPGTYSLLTHSKEETVARDAICFGDYDAVAVICDATALERNLNLVFQVLEITDRVIVCINLIDEAEKKGICINAPLLSRELGIPVIPTVARNKKGLDRFLSCAAESCGKTLSVNPKRVRYPDAIQQATERLMPAVEGCRAPEWTAARLLESNAETIDKIMKHLPYNCDRGKLKKAVEMQQKELLEQGYDTRTVSDRMVASFVLQAEITASSVVNVSPKGSTRDRKIDKIVTGKFFAFPIMIALLLFVFFITVSGANYPSEKLFEWLSALNCRIGTLLVSVGTPEMIRSAVVDGMLRVLFWVVSVMLPPMAIFFPLFTLLEDFGYLPRVSYNLDRFFKKCSSCGKQSLTICMGFGCNAVGVTGCRIIDSPRERLIGILTNSFIPCNGRYPAMIAIISIFFVGAAHGFLGSAILTAAVVFSVAMAMFASWLLSKTLLKGVPSSFTLELPPYRTPQFFRVIIRSVLDRTLFVLARAAAVAAPAGLVIWLLSNITLGGGTLLSYITELLDPLGKVMGLDGVILAAFILGFPANEIVIPLMLMGYSSSGVLADYSSIASLKTMLLQNGWQLSTAVCFLIFMIMHFPCSTTLLTIKKETGSFKQAAVSVLLPLLFGVAACCAVNGLFLLFN